jgi:hypothetical protein
MVQPLPALPSPPGITVAEAAKRLGVTEAAIRQRLRRGTLRSVHRDGHVYVQLGPYHPSDTPLDSASDATPSDTADSTAVEAPPDTPVTPASPAAVVPAVLDAVRVAYDTAVAANKELVTQLQSELTFLRAELERKDSQLQGEQETRRREVSELHVLLQRAQAHIPLPTAAARPITEDTGAPELAEKRRRWWWPF